MAKDNKNVYYGTGRRKSSVARVRLVSGTGKITVNGKDVREYFPYETLVMDLTQPLVLTNTNETFDVIAAKRGCLTKGGVADYEKVSNIIVNDLKNGYLGNITLDRIEE